MIDLQSPLTSAIAYWEPRRLLYNAMLLAVVVTSFSLAPSASRRALSFELFEQLYLLAVLANVAYCAAYAVDVAALLSGFRATWLRRRWVLLAVGMLFAAVPAHFISRGLFSAGAG
jgi:hypothetical protein